MRERLLLSVKPASGDLPLPVMTIIALLLLMLPYLIYRYTGKSVTEYLRLSVLIGKINALGDRLRSALTGKKTVPAEREKKVPPRSEASGAPGRKKNYAQADYLRFISRLLDFARKNRLFAIVPGNIRQGGKTAEFAALLVTNARVIGIMAYAFDGEISCREGAQWKVLEEGNSRQVGDLGLELMQQEKLLKTAAERIGLDANVCETVMVFTGRNAMLSPGSPLNALTQDTFFERFLTQDDLQGRSLVPADTGKKLNLLRSGK